MKRQRYIKQGKETKRQKDGRVERYKREDQEREEGK
jgi:hypothetical protein